MGTDPWLLSPSDYDELDDYEEAPAPPEWQEWDGVWPPYEVPNRVESGSGLTPRTPPVPPPYPPWRRGMITALRPVDVQAVRRIIFVWVRVLRRWAWRSWRQGVGLSCAPVDDGGG